MTIKTNIFFISLKENVLSFHTASYEFYMNTLVQYLYIKRDEKWEEKEFLEEFTSKVFKFVSGGNN